MNKYQQLENGEDQVVDLGMGDVRSLDGRVMFADTLF